MRTVFHVVWSFLPNPTTCSSVEAPQGFCHRDVKNCDTGSSMHMLDSIAQTYSTSLKEFSELHHFVQEFRKQQLSDAFFKRSLEDRLGHMASLMEYCKDKLHTNLDIHVFDEGPGILTTKDLSKNDVQVTVQLADTLNSLDGEKQFACLKDPLKLTEDSPYRGMVFVALRLITEYNKPNSKWQPYINSLPTSFEMGQNFSPKEFTYMLGSQAMGSIILSFQAFFIVYIQIYKHLLANPGVCDGEI